MLNKDLFDNLIAELLPEMNDPSARKALVESALHGSAVLNRIQWDGAADTFTKRLLRLLDDFGQIAPGRPALAALLDEVATQVGVDKQARLAALRAQLQSPAPKPIAQASAPPPATTAPGGGLYVFLSYARPDATVAARIETFLTAAGVRVFRDTSDIGAGDNWDLKIEAALRDCQCMVLLLSPASMPDRKEVHREWFRFDQKGKPIYPLYLQDCELHSRFDSRNYIDARADLEGALDRLLGDMRRAFPASAPASGSAPPARELELAYLEKLREQELSESERYTPMSGASHRKRVEMQAVFEYKPFQLMPLGKSLQRETAPRKFDNAVAEIRGHFSRCVLLGEPGGGKTTTIWKLAADLVETALRDPAAPIPLLVRLGQWTDAGQPLAAFLASQLGELGLSLDRLLADRRAALLLDGLNELPAGQRDEKYPQVQALLEAHPALMAVVSCRELDYTVDLKLDRIVITPLDPIRIRAFARNYLGPERGDALFWKLAGPKAETTHRRFLRALGDKLPDPDRTFWLDPQLPDGIPDATRGWSKEYDWHWQRWIGERERPSSLMVLARNPFMLWMLTGVYADLEALPDNRGELFQLFAKILLKRERIADDEQTALMDGLAAVAYTMQARRMDGDAGDALTVLPNDEVVAMIGERLRYLAGSASILSLGEQVRFTHQLLQEYFAARRMDAEIRAGRLKAADIWPADRWWERRNWEEAAVLLAGLHGDDCSRIVEWAAEANPEVAAMCLARGGADCNEATKSRLRAAWLPRLSDLTRDPNPAARAAVGRALGLVRLDNRRGVGVVIGANNVALPDFDWVEIPAGEFQYGDESEDAAGPQKLTLPAFRISRYPVTEGQFQTFLDDPEGFADPRWFEGMAAKEDDRPMGEQAFQFSNHPRDTVNWYQAMAFCRWLSWRMGHGYDLRNVADWAVRLPTEFEWEKAARGTDGRIYPYEGDFDPAKGNTRETGINQTSAVGIYPNGASPYGVLDMSGNVWEWCLTDYKNPASEARHENLQTDEWRVLRGGSWVYLLTFARAVSRNYYPPADRGYYSLGFRVLLCVRPPSQDVSDHWSGGGARSAGA
jgi:formylglycine-generating enzyme required for sulfatase activity